MWGLLFLTEIYELELIVAMHYDCYDIAVGGTLTCVIIYRRSAAWTDREQSVALKRIAPRIYGVTFTFSRIFPIFHH